VRKLAAAFSLITISYTEPLLKRDCHAAIAAFSFCLRAVNFENGGVVLTFPRLLYEGDFQRNLH